MRTRLGISDTERERWFRITISGLDDSPLTSKPSSQTDFTHNRRASQRLNSQSVKGKSSDIEIYYEGHGMGQPVVLIRGYPSLASPGSDRKSTRLNSSH